VVVGSLNLDHTVGVERLPPSGATVAGRDYATAAGGKGLNQAVAAARQGADVEMIGALGDDAAGDRLADVLAEEGIATSGIRRRGGPSGTALITVASDGTNTIVVAAGANGELTADDIDPERFGGAAVVLCQLEIPLEVVEAALRAGRRAGALTVLNPAPAPEALPPGLLGLVDLVVPNETEAASLTQMSAGGADPSGGVEGPDGDSPGVRERARRAGAALVAAGAGTALVTIGRHGAVIVTAGATLDIPAFVVEAVDTTAAGDAFIGALVADLAAGEPMAVAARRGAAAGALTATKRGAVPSLPSRHDVDELLEQTAHLLTSDPDRTPRGGGSPGSGGSPSDGGPPSPGGSRSRPRSEEARSGPARRPRRDEGPGPGRRGPPRPGGSRS
jgi:ribokinase